jgi:hypothetical protein
VIAVYEVAQATSVTTNIPRARDEIMNSTFFCVGSICVIGSARPRPWRELGRTLVAGRLRVSPSLISAGTKRKFKS